MALPMMPKGVITTSMQAGIDEAKLIADRKEAAAKRARETINVKVDVSAYITRRQLGDFADDWYAEWEKALTKIVYKVMVLSKGKLRPRNISGKLSKSIKIAQRGTGARITVGTAERLKYVAPAHWGWSGVKIQDWFLFRTVYPEAKPGKGNSGPVASWITSDFQTGVDKAIARVNRKGGVIR